MASLLVRLHEAHFDALPAGEEGFADTAGNVHAEAIDKLAAAGVTTGRTPSVYGPAGQVTRAQMASFLVRLLALWVRQGLVEVVDEEDPGVQEGNHASFAPSVSASGRHVAFVSQATNLVAQDAGPAAQVFVRDRASGRTTLVSVGPNGEPGDADSDAPSISGDGRYVAFASQASNLVAGDTNGVADIFVHDRIAGATQRVSMTAGGGQANDHSDAPAISADGRVVAFTSRASNLVAADSNATTDVFAHDRASGATSRVSISSGGGQADGPSGDPSISGDGRYVVFASQASDLVAGDTNDEVDVFLHDRATQTTQRVSVGAGGGQADGPSQAPSISPDGDYVVFQTGAGNLLGAAEDPDMWHVVRHDRASGSATVVTRKADGGSHVPVVSDDGRVAFVSSATNLSPHWIHNGFDQIYEWRQDENGERIVQMSVHDFRGQADADTFQPAISANGYVVAFVSPATALTAAGTRGVTNVYAHTWVTDVVCIAVLISAADLAAGPWRPPDTGQDDGDRCEDRSTQPLTARAEDVHNVLHAVAQSQRTTAAVRARTHTGECLVVFAGGRQMDLNDWQKRELRPPGEMAAEPIAGRHRTDTPEEDRLARDAEITALTYIIEIRMWKPLALGIAPPTRVICDGCRAFIAERGGHVAADYRTAVWW